LRAKKSRLEGEWERVVQRTRLMVPTPIINPCNPIQKVRGQKKSGGRARINNKRKPALKKKKGGEKREDVLFAHMFRIARAVTAEEGTARERTPLDRREGRRRRTKKKKTR